jgi:hypothetical protein
MKLKKKVNKNTVLLRKTQTEKKKAQRRIFNCCHDRSDARSSEEKLRHYPTIL